MSDSIQGFEIMFGDDNDDTRAWQRLNHAAQNGSRPHASQAGTFWSKTMATNDSPPGFPDDDNDGPGEDNPPPDSRMHAVTLQSIEIEATMQRNRIPSNTKEFPLTGSDKYALVNAEDYEKLIPYRWYIHSNGYARATINHKRVYMHRFILPPPEGYEVDHMNGDKLDNRRMNLRIATRRQNSQNMRPKGGYSQFIGVTKMKQGEWERWVARIRIDGKRTQLGYFTNEIEAARAFDRAAHKHHGEFAKLNFPHEYHCTNCDGAHSTQRCPEIHQALLADEPAIAVYETREMIRLWGASRTLLVAKLARLTRPQLVCQAVAFAAWLETRTQAGLSAASVLHIWETMLDGPAAPAIQAAA